MKDRKTDDEIDLGNFSVNRKAPINLKRKMIKYGVFKEERDEIDNIIERYIKDAVTEFGADEEADGLSDIDGQSLEREEGQKD